MAAKKCLICNAPFSGRRDAKTCSAKCRKRLQKVRWSFYVSPVKKQLAKTLLILFVGAVSALAAIAGIKPAPASAATSSYLNFQSRLLTNTGAVVPDGTYNIEFKIYKSLASGSSAQGVCVGGGTDDCLWKETRQNSASQGVRVVNGYMSVNLGSVSSFPAINWDQQLYLSMNIAGTGSGGSPSYDGEMNPRITLTALPYSFRAGAVAKTDGSGNVGTLSFNTTANSPVITLPDATGTVCLQTSSSCGFLTSTTGVQLQGSSPGTPQTGHFNISGTGIAGTSLLSPLIDQSTAAALGIANSTATAVNIGNSSSNITTTVTGLAVFKPSTGNDSTTAFRIQNAASGSLLNIDSTNSIITLNGVNSPTPRAWTSTTAITAAREEHATVYANGYVYVIAGVDSGFSTSNVVYYAKVNADGSIGSWNTGNSTGLTNRYRHAAVTTNGYIYLLGGNVSGSSSTDVLYAKINADGNVGNWTATTSLTAAREDLTSVVANGYIYAIAGGTPSAQSTIYYAKLNADGTVGSWSTGNSTGFTARTMASSVSANGYIYVIGGSSAQTSVYYAKLNSDGTNGNWSTTNTLGTGVHNATAVALNGYIYVIGGNNGSVAINTVQYAQLNSNGTTGSWSTTTSTNLTARSSHTSFVANGYIYALGGIDSGGSVVSSTYYTSLERTIISGSLDLTGGGGQNLVDGGNQSGALTAGNTEILGQLDVRGSASVLQGLNVGDTLTVGGSSLFKNTTNSTTAFQVQNSSSRSLLTIDSSSSLIQVGNTTDGSNIVLSANGNANGTIRKNMNVTGTVSVNDVVEIDTVNAGKVQQAAASSAKVFGIASSGVTNAAEDIVVYGTYQVNADATAVSIGDLLVTSSTAGKATPSTGSAAIGTVIGRAMSSKGAGAGTVWVSLTLEGGGSDTLQTAYNNSSAPAAITTTDNKNIVFNLADTSTDSSFLVNLQCATSCGANGKFAVQSASTDVLSVAPNGGTISVGIGGFANTVQVGNTTGAVSQTINIGSNSTASSTNNVNIGSSIAGTTAITGSTTVTNRTSGSSDTFNVSNSTSTGTIALFKDNATTVFSLADGGAALFQNQTNSATAFQIQNATGASLFTADTSNLRLIVGTGSTGTTTPTILVLDNKSSSGDPTGVNGAMYYNASSHSFRCYLDGEWQNCGGLTYANTSTTGNTFGNSNAENNYASNYTLPANYCQPGRVIRVMAHGSYKSTGANSLTMRAKFGSTTIGTSSGNPGTAAADREWKMTYLITCTATGVSGTVEGQGSFTAFNNSSGAASEFEMFNTATVTVNTTTTQVLQLSAEWSVANASNTTTLRQLVIEGIGP
jgi:hypothetical protein